MIPLLAASLENVLSGLVEDASMTTESSQPSLAAHLASWGLKRFTSDAEYFAWQRQTLTLDQLNELHRYVERKRQGTPCDEVAFYDATADPKILPVLYSQRYDYYHAIGPRVAARIRDARTVLDFGCGAGILTTFYARQSPDTSFVGIDRSPASIARAQQQASDCHVTNVRFECLDATQEAPSGHYDLIVATHALVQAEDDPGVPSRDWTTFERADDPSQQRAFEERTGIGARLDALRGVLVPDGRMIVFEKTRQLSRRIPFQRALAARGLHLLEQPEAIRYLLVEDIADDGPFYSLQMGNGGEVTWQEAPEPDEGQPVNPTAFRSASVAPGTPLYENHWSSAQHAWQRLTRRQIIKETTREGPEGQQLHVEMGLATEGAYLYASNTFDRRQLVVMRQEDRDALEAYFAEIVSGAA